MAEISMKREHGLGPHEIRDRIETLADKISVRLGGSWNWEDDVAVCEVHGAKACVGYDEKLISIEVWLPFSMRLFRGKLEAKIEEYFVRYIEKDEGASG